MPVEIASHVADGIGQIGRKVEVIWHGGEPLTCGVKHFATLLKPFEGLRQSGTVTHAVQTNATLIDEAWCELFKSYRFEVGASIDGPPRRMSRRLDWRGRDSYDSAMRGIGQLRAAHIDFTAICVVDSEGLRRGPELYNFFALLGCSSVGFNIEERLGTYQASGSDDDELVTRFWAELFVAWRENPVVEVREISQVLSWMRSVCESKAVLGRRTLYYDIFPTVGYNGDVVLLAPEFLGTRSGVYADFVAGNVLQKPLPDILNGWREVDYVPDFVKGLRQCARACEHFEHCRGGRAGNKFFELGTTNGTETIHCRNSEQRVAEAILRSL